MTTPPSMTEKELQEAVIDLAHLFGWQVAHFRPAQNSRGDWRTPVAADGAGFPDLVLVSDTAVIFAELKSAKGRMSDEQKHWILRLREAGSMAAVWRPADWDDGTIADILQAMK